MGHLWTSSIFCALSGCVYYFFHNFLNFSEALTSILVVSFLLGVIASTRDEAANVILQELQSFHAGQGNQLAEIKEEVYEINVRQRS